MFLLWTGGLRGHQYSAPPENTLTKNALADARATAPELGLAESLPVLNGFDEGLNHLSLAEIAGEGVELSQPEVVTREVRVGRVVRIATKVAAVLHQDDFPGYRLCEIDSHQ